MIFTLSDKWKFYLGYDIGLEQKTKGSNVWYPWQGGALIIRRQMGNKLFLTARTETLIDLKHILYPPVQGNKLALIGFSMNLDYQFSPGVLWRIEPKWYYNLEPYFQRGDQIVRHNVSCTSSIALQF